jgi:hypothetical protein
MTETNPRLQTSRFARQAAVADWAAQNPDQRLLVSTKPCYDTKSLTGSVVANDSASGVIYVKFVKGQELAFFTSEVGKASPLAADASHTYTEADTNLTTARQTPGGNSEQVIEGLGLMCRGVECEYATPASFTASGDAVVTAALQGKTRLVDPSGLVKPVECESPYMLENVIFQALLPHLTLELSFDNSDRNEKLCTLDFFPQASGGSYLRSNGEPSSRNRFEFPEGYRWKRNGAPDSVNLSAVAKLRNDVVVAMSPVTAGVANAVVNATNIHVLARLSLFGLNIRAANSN